MVHRAAVYHQCTYTTAKSGTRVRVVRSRWGGDFSVQSTTAESFFFPPPIFGSKSTAPIFLPPDPPGASENPAENATDIFNTHLPTSTDKTYNETPPCLERLTHPT